MSVRPSTTFVAGAITALVLGTGTAYAATGGNLIIGHANSAYRMTTLTNYGGSAVYLRSRYGYPSFRVNRTTKIPYLNSDYLDGLSSERFALSTPHIGTVVAYGQAIDSDPNHPGPDQVIAVATCPTGSQLVGGGGLDGTGNNLFWNSPGDDGQWVVVSRTQDFSDDSVHQVEAQARCWNPRANVADFSGRTSAAALKTPAGRTIMSRLRTMSAR